MATTKLRSAELAAEAARLRARGLTLRQIAAEQHTSSGRVYERLMRAYQAVMVEAVDQLRRTECDRLDMVIAKLWDIVDRRHIAHGNGRPVMVLVGYETHEDGTERLDDSGKRIPRYETLEDDGPKMAALNSIVRASESKRKLLGLDAPTRTAITVITEDAVDARLRQLDDEWAALNGEPASA